MSCNFFSKDGTAIHPVSSKTGSPEQTIAKPWMSYFQSTVSLPISSLSAVQRLISGYDRLVELDHQRGAFVPVSSDLCREAAVCQDGLHDSCSESGAVQTAVLLGHRDV